MKTAFRKCFIVRVSIKFEKLTLLQSWCDLASDLAARLIPAWYEAISWRSWNTLYYFYRACKKYRAISDTKVVRPRSFRRYRGFTETI